MTTEHEPEVMWDELVASTSFREIFRHERGGETRIHKLRVVAKGAELWRVTEIPGEPVRSIKECDLTDPDEALEFLEEVQRTLKAGGWREV